MEFTKLFEPGRIGTMEVKNRIVLPALGLNFCTDKTVNDRWLNFYEERARGGVGLMIVSAGIEYTGEKGYELLNTSDKMGYIPSLGHDKYLPGWKRLADATHKYGAKLGVQITHLGKYAHSSVIGGEQPVSPSAIQANMTVCGLPGEMPRELTIPEIKLIQRNIANTVKRAREAGIDIVELNVCSGYLIREFLSPITNKRTDEYGGSIENRMRFLLELIAQIQSTVGKDYPLMVRLSASEFLPGGNTLNETRIVAQALEKAGLHAISVVGGGHETMVPLSPMAVPRGAFVYLAQGIKEVVQIPIIASARINNPIMAENILRDGRADFIAIARAIMADPDFPNKAQEGKLDEIRPCIACNQGCFDLVFEWVPVTCMMNPRVGWEKERHITPASQKKKVMVIGGGPAGLEAAQVLAQRGHTVSLYEKQDQLGGQVNLSAIPPTREEFVNIPRYFGHQLNKLGVKVTLGREVDAQLINQEKPDAVIVATGAEPLIPDIPGIRGENVITAWDALQDKKPVGKNVVVLGGGSVGCETAIYLAKKGAIDAETSVFLASYAACDPKTALALTTKGTRNVTIIEMLPRIGQDFGKGNRWVFMGDIKRMGIKTITKAEVKEITPEGVKVKIGDQEQLIPADTVVLAVGAQPNNRLYNEIKDKVPETYLIGDAQKPRKTLDAIHEGFEVACRI
jgi:2,4-dienoyl-CoA reductase (NADPH2)